MVPITEYGRSVWGFCKATEIDLVQNRAMPSLGRSLCLLRFWNRMSQMNDARLTKSVFNADYELCNNNWSSRAKLLLQELNMTDSYMQQIYINLPNALISLKLKSEIDWRESLQRKPKLRNIPGFQK